MSEESDFHVDASKVAENAPDSPKKPVKSTAVVKYSAVQNPATYAELKRNTDLNLPPSNWLSSSAESYGLQSDWSSQSRSFSSFRMAHMFPDCVGEVDVVSEAENIKKLLKMHYSHDVISMVVHRIENTLLLDDFDVHRYLLRQAETEWEWLKKFVCEQVFQNLGNKEKRLIHKSSRNTLQQKNLVSKFLYHSLVLADKEKDAQKPELPVKNVEPSLPEPPREQELPDPNCNHNFARNVLWTFENIQMLIGTDMPIFGGPTQPCISLRLRDVTKPISVLTGIDYWLDNLMSNVPEVIMCYHLDGIVQKYELIKTEDLPNYKDAKFSPKVVRDVAQNILSFLKNNVTKAGHTYWLFKGKDADVVKLYDLTSLCSEVNDDKGQNPFTVPVAMLLYRVARNMKYSLDYIKNRGTIRMLLKNCIQLLDKKKYPQIVTSAHYMLSDLYVPAGTNPSSPDLMEQNDDDDTHSDTYSSHESDKESDKMEEDVSAAIKSLSLTRIKEQAEYEEFKYKPPPIIGTVEDRCKVALEHIASGLECLKYFPLQGAFDEDQQEEKEAQKETDEVQQMANPFQAIPLPYITSNETDNLQNNNNNSPSHKKKAKKKKKGEKNAPLKKEEMEATKTLLCKPETLPTWQAPKKSDNLSWSAHLKILLYEKAALTMGVLAEYEYSNKNYGSALYYIAAVLRCQKILSFYLINNEHTMSYFLGRAGDCGSMTVQDWNNIEKHRNDYEMKNETTRIIDDILALEELENYETELLPKKFESKESTLVDSYKCYEKALALQQPNVDRNNLQKRVGNTHNELGVLYLNKATGCYQQETENSKSHASEVGKYLELSQNHLEAGIKTFEIVHDDANQALLHANIGRLMRSKAHMQGKERSDERHYYEKAIVCYQKALQVLGNRKCNREIWDNVNWELSTTLFTMATLLQDYPAIENKSEEELEREVVEILNKALKLCDTKLSGSRLPIYQFRTASIHHRLSSLYHRIYRKTDLEIDNAKRKKSLQLCELNYEKAAKLFLSLEETKQFLTVQMERVALAENQAETSTLVNSKLKAFKNGLKLILQCRAAIDILNNKNNSDLQFKNGETKVDSIENDCDRKLVECEQTKEEMREIEDQENLINLLQQRLKFILWSLIKLCMNNKNVSSLKKESDNLELYKQCYNLALRQEQFSGNDLLKHMSETLQKIEDISSGFN